jgi:hypothetical protein
MSDAAYAYTGDCEKAVRTENEAMVLLKDEEAKSNYAIRLEVYESNMPYREHPDGQPPSDAR